MDFEPSIEGEYGDADSENWEPPQVGWGFAVVDGTHLQFALYCDSAALTEALGVQRPDTAGSVDHEDFMRWDAELNLATFRATDKIVHELSPETRARLHVEWWPGPKQAGPGAGPETGAGPHWDLIQFLISDHPIDRLASLLTIGTFGWLAIKRGLDKLLGQSVGVSDGCAVLLAAQAVEEQFGTIATELVEVVGLHPDNPLKVGTPAGYSVTLRDHPWLFTVIVSFHGLVLGSSRVEMPRPDFPANERAIPTD